MKALLKNFKMQDSQAKAIRLTEEKAALTREVAECKAKILEKEHELRLKGHALERADKERQGLQQEFQDLSARSRSEATELKAQLNEARQTLADQSRRCLVSPDSLSGKTSSMCHTFSKVWKSKSARLLLWFQ